MPKLVNVIQVLILGVACLSGQEAVDKTPPPKELLQYVRDARKAGITPTDIQQNAVNAGWPAGAVTDALAYVNVNDKPAAAPATTAASNAKAPAPEVMQPASPGTAPDATAAKPAESNSAPESKTPPPPVSGAAAGDSRKEEIANLPSDYTIGAGDVLKITVWHEPDASMQSAIVMPSGRISVPLLHEIEVVGLTLPQLEKMLTEKFSSLINSPEVSVAVLQMNSKKIYMTGKVKKEGPLPYIYQMTVMQALTEAGGVTDYAKKKNIYVLRTENGKQFKLPFDYAAVLRGEHLETNRVLIPGDMIVVP